MAYRDVHPLTNIANIRFAKNLKIITFDKDWYVWRFLRIQKCNCRFIQNLDELQKNKIQ